MLKAFAPYAVAHGIRDNQPWTLADAGLIGAIGRRRGYTFCAVSMNINETFVIQILTDIQQTLGRILYDPNTDRFAPPQWYPGWLYDLVWLKYDENKSLIDAPLVMESEWDGKNDVKDDFQKLLLARSKYRVMIFQCDKNTKFDKNTLVLLVIILLNGVKDKFRHSHTLKLVIGIFFVRIKGIDMDSTLNYTLPHR